MRTDFPDNSIYVFRQFLSFSKIQGKEKVPGHLNNFWTVWDIGLKFTRLQWYHTIYHITPKTPILTPPGGGGEGRRENFKWNVGSSEGSFERAFRDENNAMSPKSLRFFFAELWSFKHWDFAVAEGPRRGREKDFPRTRVDKIACRKACGVPHALWHKITKSGWITKSDSSGSCSYPS